MKIIAAAVLGFFLLPGVVRAHYHELGYGEPYELTGKRIVFTTWYWVRPGEYDWVDDQGKTVLAKKTRLTSFSRAASSTLAVPVTFRSTV